MKNAGNRDALNKSESDPRVCLFDDVYVTELGTDFELLARKEGFRLIAGLDEVGRGCIAGPVVAAACILDLDKPLPAGLNDSKKLTEKQRDEISAELKENCICYATGRIEADEIDRINILEATKKAMLAAIDALRSTPDYLLIDALELKACRLPQKAIIKGDSISASIAAASVLAKTFRDALMTEFDGEFPEYGFAGHKGYGAASHYDALRRHGPCSLHRLSFKGVLEDARNLPHEPILL